jgi:SAM-dependent methyltransferase
MGFLYVTGMSERDWNEHYAAGQLPWDTGVPDEELVAAVERGLVAPGRTLEIGCGTGTNALWLAQRGFEVVGVDVAPLAIEAARKKTPAGARCEFAVLDFLAGEPPRAPYDFVFDRGCFHIFDDHETRARFASRVAALLAPGGQWLSLIGSTEGGPRDTGPPRRTARDIMNAIEPSLEIVELHAFFFDAHVETPPKAWSVRARRRDVAAQPSTRH